MTSDTRAVIIESANERALRRSSRLPERLPHRWALALACADAAIVLFFSMIPFSSTGNGLAAAFVVATAICLTCWQGGLYARSYAVYPHDEAYYACACVAIAALPAGFVLAVVGQISLPAIAVALVVSALAMSVLRVKMHLLRRTGPPLAPGIRSITPQGWSNRESPGYRLSKRIFDIVIGALALTISAPVMLAAAVAILVKSGRPILFRQERMGENGLPFTMYKLRTMYTGAGEAWAQPGDGRVMRLGVILRRFSIDELPQFFNVMRGEMSIVGPRPEMMDFNKTFTQSIDSYAQRHVVTPGITGWAQLYFNRYHTPDDERELLQYDLFYVEYASVVLDLALVLKTACEVLFHRAV